MTTDNITTGYKEETRQRLLQLKNKGVSISFFVNATGINRNTLYTLTQEKPKSISVDKLDKIAVVCTQLERILEQ